MAAELLEEPLVGMYDDSGRYIRITGAECIKRHHPSGMGFAEPKRMLTPKVKQALSQYKYKLAYTEKNGTEWYETVKETECT